MKSKVRLSKPAARWKSVGMALLAPSIFLLGSCNLDGGSSVGFYGCCIPSTGVYDVIISGSGEIDDEPTGVTWEINARLFVLPLLGSNSSNGLNIVNIAILTGDNPMQTEIAGAIYFGTNTTLKSLTGTEGTPAYDVAVVQIDEAAGKVDLVLDSQLLNATGATEQQINRYRISTGFEEVYNLSSGDMHLTFTNNGNNISGTFFFVGAPRSEFPQEARYAYRANLAGIRLTGEGQ